MKLAFPLLALVIAGCASPPPPAFSLSQEEARALAKKEGRPLLVLSVVGDLEGRL